jgi:hypothetical protein
LDEVSREAEEQVGREREEKGKVVDGERKKRERGTHLFAFK